MQNLPGLTPAWLIALAAILAFLLGLGGEAFQRGLYDFLKDFQGALVGLAAITIAVWAARPVFGQLEAARRQAAVVAYETLALNLASLTDEQILIDEIDLAIFSINFEFEEIQAATDGPQGAQWEPDGWRQHLENHRLDLEALERDSERCREGRGE